MPLGPLSQTHGRNKCCGCPMPLKGGNSRPLMCTGPGTKGHTSAPPPAHQLPQRPGPNHGGAWPQAMAHAASLEGMVDDSTEGALGGAQAQAPGGPRGGRRQIQGGKALTLFDGCFCCCWCLGGCVPIHGWLLPPRTQQAAALWPHWGQQGGMCPANPCPPTRMCVWWFLSLSLACVGA